ncbi:hypothetical protein BC669P3_00043 [Bacteroides phage BC669P3]|nr:hypothetical protein BC669P3_00043 [Bacteroides phage BC669P3]
MKIKVTFSFLEGEDTTVTMEVRQDTIAELLKEYCFSDIADKASDKTGGRTRYGYIIKVEDIDD